MSIILATNNIADVGGNPVKDTTAGRFRSTHVGYGIRTVGDASSQINTAEFKHAPVGGDVTWVHAKVFMNNNIGSNNGVGSFWCSFQDAAAATIADFDLASSQDVHATVFGTTTVNHTPNGNANPYSAINQLFDLDIKLTVTVATIRLQAYMDQSKIPYFDVSVANNGKTAPVKETWRCHDWVDTGFTCHQVLSEYIVADEDTRGLSLTDKFTLGAGTHDDWTGDVADLFDENVSTGVTAATLNKRTTQLVTAYVGPDASVVRAIAITAYGDVAGATGDFKGSARGNATDYFTGKAGLKNAVAESRSVAFDTNPIDSSPWLEADFTDFEFGIESAS